MENIVKTNDTGYFESLPRRLGGPAPEADHPGSTGVLLSTEWSQSGILRLGDNTSIRCNEYTPFDPTTQVHSVTGCTNTAAAQIIYYFIEKAGLELSLTLSNGDAYTSRQGDIVIDVKADGSTPGTISFSTVNSRLGSFTVDSAVHAAALMYACGVIQQAKYSSASTSTSWNTELFYRAGLQSANHFYPGDVSESSYWGTNDAYGNFTISDAGYEVIIENLLAGRPVGVSYPGHALIIDGYDLENDLFHINFGWGADPRNRWYSRDEMREQGYHEFVYDLFTEQVETLTVTDGRAYGTGTLVRAMEQARSIVGNNTVLFSSEVSGKSVRLSECIELRDSTTIRDFDLAVTVTGARGLSWGVAFYAAEESTTVFENFGGALIVDTKLAHNAAMYFSGAERLSFSGCHTLLYAGNYALGGDHDSGAASVLDAMREARDNGTALDAFVTDSAQYSFFGTAGNDTIILAGNSLVAGDVDLGSGNDTLSLTGGSRLYGNIQGTGSNTVTIDSSSEISGLLYSPTTLRFVLDSAAEDHALFLVEENVYNIYANAAVSVDVTAARTGSYILFAADEGAAYAEWLDRIVLTISCDGQSDYTLCGNGASTGEYADVVCEDRMLKLNVRQLPPTVPPQVVSVHADTVSPTRNDVTVYADFNASVRTAQYSLDGENWLSYANGVAMAANGTVRFRGIDASGNVSDVIGYTVTNIDRIAPVITLTGDNSSPVHETMLSASADDGSALYYRVNGGEWIEYTGTLAVGTNAVYDFRATDAAGNTGSASIVFANLLTEFPEELVGTADALSWSPTGAANYIVEYSADDFEHSVRVSVSRNALDSFALPSGNYQWRVKGADDENFVRGEDIVSFGGGDAPQAVQAAADGIADLIFGRTVGVWSDRYLAMHLGSESWQGTLETTALSGKGRIADLYFGSEDANVLFLTDGANGDALFVDDVYTALPGSIAEQQSRIAGIDEIRAGAGDDVVDLTSQRFEYSGGGATVRGGLGDDVIWANEGDNFLFGDSGNDRLVGASGNDVLAGGSGSDSMHGGGGNDLFTFSANFGTDTVEQLPNGEVTLWFASGELSNWDASTLTYADGNGSVTVYGVSAENVSLKFGDDGSERYAALAALGAFAEFSSENIFERPGRGVLASL